ncbi:ATP-grasp domain-containing protein [Borborobacter arsenicus]|uniref:ATP-grasp domain-containing protein n=1 Tax=Borborobacter arsenicus TaxID=1851146 RepID=UPI001FE11A84|nr:RimK family alpha-L-glutamate ligase [Pseudaminobacter arsenicus]
MKPRIFVVNDASGTQSRSISVALERHGAKTVTDCLANIAFDTESPTGLRVSGFAPGELPDAVLVRSISAGSFEAITRRLGILHALGKLGVPVWNSAQAIERCVDKSMTTFLIQQAGLPTPPTHVVEGREAAEALVRQHGSGLLVLKPLFGAQGRGIRMIRAIEDLPPAEDVDDVYYLQHYVARAGPPFHDYRVFVCAGRVLAMMARRGNGWITNINRGAAAEIVSDRIQGELEAMALAATGAVGADFAGVDIVPDDRGRLFVLEVNSMPAWSGLQSVVQINIAEAIAEALLAFLHRRTAAGAALASALEPAAASVDS